MNSKRYRTSVRWIHLALSAVLGTYVYSPWSSNTVFHAVVQWLLFPLLAVTGVALWKQAWVLKKLGRPPGVALSQAARGGS